MDIGTKIPIIPPETILPDYELTRVSLTAPVDSYTNVPVLNQVFSWSIDSDMAAGYVYSSRFVLSKYADLKETCYSQSGIKTLRHTVSDYKLEYKSVYYWAVYVLTDKGEKVSSIRSFTTEANAAIAVVPAAPTAFEAFTTTTTFTIEAGATDDITEGFKISVFPDGSASPIAGYNKQAFSAGSLTITVTGLTANTTYDVSVWSTNSVGDSLASCDFSVTTDNYDWGYDFTMACNESSDEKILEAVLMDAVIDTGGVTVAAAGSLIKIYRDSNNTVSQIYLVDSTNPNLWTMVYSKVGPLANVLPGQWKCRLLSNLWDEQDDGYSNDAQMCALYMALARLGEFSSAPPEAMQAMSNRANQYLHTLRIKYNASKVNRVFTQVGF